MKAAHQCGRRARTWRWNGSETTGGAPRSGSQVCKEEKGGGLCLPLSTRLLVPTARGRAGGGVHCPDPRVLWGPPGPACPCFCRLPHGQHRLASVCRSSGPPGLPRPWLQGRRLGSSRWSSPAGPEPGHGAQPAGPSPAVGFGAVVDTPPMASPSVGGGGFPCVPQRLPHMSGHWVFEQCRGPSPVSGGLTAGSLRSQRLPGPFLPRDLGPSLSSLGPSARAAGVDTKVLWILSRLSARM